MYFYENSDNLFIVGNHILPFGRFLLKISENDTYVSVYSVLNRACVFQSTLITNIQKEDNSFYVDLNDLLFNIKDFFNKSTAPVLLGTFDDTFDNTFN